MPRGMVGLLAAVAAAMAVLASLAHGYVFWAVFLAIFASAGLVGYATAPELPSPTDIPAQLAPSPEKKVRHGYAKCFGALTE